MRYFHHFDFMLKRRDALLKLSDALAEKGKCTATLRDQIQSIVERIERERTGDDRKIASQKREKP